MPLLSVLLPVKDGSATVLRAARSTLRAMPRDAELVVVDDGSTDATGEVLSRIADRRLRVVRHERPQGVASSLNEALARTDSRVVARMDADDVSLPWRFRVQLPALSGADHVFGALVLIDGRGRPTGLADPSPVSTEQAPLHLLLENPFAHPTLVARRTALEAVGGYRPTAVEDYDLWLRAVAAGQRLRKLAAPVLAYRRHPGQATQSWRRDAPDALLDESYGALLPAELRPATSGLRSAAVFRDAGAADPVALRALHHHVEQQARRLGAPARRRVLRRARPATVQAG
ncbi:glycosyltransferase family 2 protein [uncultured Amnibacterium sp.]|uniref:glycosyltransferase family 2 protein n=1 Tax=uncultured Amnibacterium sp. TaxID=1631851 RepID=UPI0035C9A5E2